MFGVSLAKKNLVSAALALVFFSANGACAADKPVSMSKYPTLKIGFTSAHFLKYLPVSLDNVKKLIDYAAQQHLSFVEVRDPVAQLSLKDCQAIAAYAAKKKMELIYAVNVGLLDANFSEVYSRAIANAKAFGGAGIVRVAANGKEFDPDGKKWWTAEEFAALVKSANQAADTAKSFGLQMIVENGREGLQGDGKTTFGFADLFGENGFNSNVGWQLDTANFFCVSREPADPQALKAFFYKNVKKVGYMHLKSSVQHVCQPVLVDHELSFNDFFSGSATANMPYLAIELDAGKMTSLDEVKDSFKKSVGYLTKNY